MSRNARLGVLLAASAEVQREVRDIGDGTLVASAKDSDGNIIRRIQSP